MQFKSPFLTFSTSHEEILKPRIFSIFVKGRGSRPAFPFVRWKEAQRCCLKVVRLGGGHSLSTCPHLEEQIMTHYFRNAVLLPQVSCFESLWMKETQQIPRSRFPSGSHELGALLSSYCHILSPLVARVTNHSLKPSSNVCVVYFPSPKPISLRKI